MSGDATGTGARRGGIPVDDVLAWARGRIEAVRLAPGQYAERIHGRACASGAALVVAARHIICEQFDADERAMIVRSFQEAQNESTGAFDDPLRHTPSKRLNVPLFGWIVRALAMLDAQPQLPTKFLRRWDDAVELLWWLGLLEWQRAPRQESLRVMNIGVPRINAYRRGVARLEQSVRSLINWLVTHQDRASGFWGPSHGSALAEGLASTFHILVVLEAAGQPVPMAERMATTVLDLWREGDGWGDSWNTMAALAILSKAAKVNEEIEGRAKELALAGARLLASQRPRASTFGATSSTLSEVVTNLEGLRTAALFTNDPSLEQCRSWRSAWDPALWACEW